MYLKPPGYGEMFTELGYGDLVRRARAGESYASLAKDFPAELLARVCAIGTADQVRDRIAKYHQAGADHIALVPCTAEDPAGSSVLTALKEQA
ncbi:LLM class flavin-dependent oxidoreductase [Actinosynnema sp. ALI-1.44]|uniref:LLM class flavin-dependent oxidoreductase n=1 Tax=Actinosynnema sp. ALI-1.44 TaxID=1933779 RepID=UPI001EDBCB0F|nr:LLM class flavin-dependent oxidoreductase [Actinosynnema sp. ALI-1.44]